MMRFLRIKNWNESYENNETRKLKSLHWVRVPNRMDGVSFRELISHRDGLAHFGVWILLLELASKQPAPRDGTFGRNGGKLPHDAESIAKTVVGIHMWEEGDVMDMVMTTARFSTVKATVSEALDRLIKLGWVEAIDKQADLADSSQVVEKIKKSGESPDVSRNLPAEQNRTEKYIWPSCDGQACPSRDGQKSAQLPDLDHLPFDTLDSTLDQTSTVKKKTPQQKNNEPWLRDVNFMTFFDCEFWPAYPRRDKKKRAAKVLWNVYQERGLDFLREKILVAVEHQKRAGGRLNPASGAQYIPLPATWLNDEEWENQESGESQSAPWRTI
jgi:hypothetical protein